MRKPGLCTPNTPVHIKLNIFIINCTSYLQSASCIRFCKNDCIAKWLKIPCLHKKLFNFEIQKCGQILCTHKTHLLMSGHKYNIIF